SRGPPAPVAPDREQTGLVGRHPDERQRETWTGTRTETWTRTKRERRGDAESSVARGVAARAQGASQPPGIGISPIADMDAHQTIVTAVLAAKSSAETPRNACWEARSETMRREIPVPRLRQRHP